MDAFPFAIRGFHSDNGSEYINRRVAELLENLLIEQTNDNALAESKNASTVRKYLGYSHIPQHFASQVNVTLSINQQIPTTRRLATSSQITFVQAHVWIGKYFCRSSESTCITNPIRLQYTHLLNGASKQSKGVLK